MCSRGSGGRSDCRWKRSSLGGPTLRRAGRIHYVGQAEFDIEEIASYTLASWGIEQADRYVTGLRLACERLAGSPLLGGQCAEPHESLRRFEYGKHMIFYQPESWGAIIVRVLHERMMAHPRLPQ